jgi:hypothetical protein
MFFMGIESWNQRKVAMRSASRTISGSCTRKLIQETKKD